MERLERLGQRVERLVYLGLQLQSLGDEQCVLDDHPRTPPAVRHGARAVATGGDQLLELGHRRVVPLQVEVERRQLVPKRRLARVRCCRV